MSKKLPNTKRFRRAKESHDKFLKSMGIDTTKKPKVRPNTDDPLDGKRHVIKQNLPPLSNGVGNGLKIKPAAQCDLPVAQVYHKGPLMVVTDMKSLEGSKRRG
jgi:hypothetical protein